MELKFSLDFSTVDADNLTKEAAQEMAFGKLQIRYSSAKMYVPGLRKYSTAVLLDTKGINTRDADV